MNHHLPHRQLEIDTLRGLACILLVSFHEVGLPETGLRLPETHPLVRFNDMLAHIRMPLFSFISGYVYAARPLRSDATRFLRGKTRRLLLPVLTMGTLFALVQTLTPGTSGDINWRLLHIEPVGHFWFLQALFIIFVVLACLERLGLLATAGRYGLVFATSLVLFAFADHLPHYFAANGVAKLLPFFLDGLACYRFAIGSITMRWVAIALLIDAVVWLWPFYCCAVDGRTAGLPWWAATPLSSI